jgi:ribosomal protein L37AE/L43A
MSKINEKLGLRTAGRRPMMKLPADRELRNKLTAARCPNCTRTGAILMQSKPGWFMCSWCAWTWDGAETQP